MSSGARAIDSPQNANAKKWLALTESRGIRKHGAFILSGRKTVPEALARHPNRFTAALARTESDLNRLALPPSVERYVLAKPVFEALDTNGTGFPLLVGEVPEMAAADFSAAPKGFELVLALGDPSNLGAALRSAAAFGATRVVLMEGAAHPFHPKALRGGANAQFGLTFLKGGDWTALEGAEGPVAALDGKGTDIEEYVWPENLRLVLGEEGRGLPPGLKATLLAIRTTGAVESLNATVAASLALSARFRRISSR
ncbi:TrmH family RNA methyltransferase [Parvibaculum sp.]|jgi:RNA methyltransferase, TrmH family|uniref:TrmH family RNA methyltransferase n=1 Tax=Parvibaculum sp. TaxID=2024848 RepID=UPI000C43E056|nr:TrmH family RNA methyltransferase [Parvibaculum sp.]MAM95732.1 RNA methyltransferase [Parvibaculum sp.]|tara:strand:+ start:14584 stop:15351 length:768 start_codon:yes stop_codon:yes gene_type:complete